MAPNYVSVTGDDLPFIHGIPGYRAIVNGWEQQGKRVLVSLDVNAFCAWLGSQPDMQRAVDLAIERHTLDIGVLQSLLGITDETTPPLICGVL
jgi:hypothetical protein